MGARPALSGRRRVLDLRTDRRYDRFIRIARGSENDPVMNRVDLDDLELDHLSFLERVLGKLAFRQTKLRLRDETLDVVADIDYHTVIHEPDDPALHFRTDRIGLTDLEPRILGRLLETEGDPLVIRIDVEDDHIHGVALLDDFRRMLTRLVHDMSEM